MSELSGFFESQWDESTSDWDRKYLAENFANYFSTLVGNGVFASPVNQLKVYALGGNLFATKGFAFIRGYWFENTEDKMLEFQPNNTSSARKDSVKLRFSLVDREIKIVYAVNDVDILRGENVFELQLAIINVPQNTSSLSNSMITDMRSDEKVCGFVKGLIDVVDTSDLFLQYNTMFDEWFDTVKNQITGDLAVQIQSDIEDLYGNLTNANEEINKIKNGSTVVSKSENSNKSDLASRLDKNAGSANRPVYFEDGIPKQCLYNLGTNVPSDAKFTDTTYANATESASGLMSNEDKAKLNKIPSIIYMAEEPISVQEGTIVFVYE